eukprot:UN04546
MLFDDNFFHNDLHPGNILVKKIDDKGNFNITMIDCGLAKSFSSKDMKNFRDLFLAICQGHGVYAGKLIYERSPHSECANPE